MNFLQMVQFVQGNIGTSTDLPFAGPSTIVGATGQYLEFVNYVQQAYKAIQVDQDNWRWRIKPGIMNLFAGQSFYTVAQIQAQIPDYEEVVHFHFIDDTQHSLICKTQISPIATTTAGTVSTSIDTYTVAVSAISTFAPFNPVLITDGTNSISGKIQSVSNKVISFAAESVVITGSPNLIAIGSPVTYMGNSNPPLIGNQTICFFIEYQNWRGWKDRNVLPVGKPTFYTKIPDGSLEFNPVPDSTNSPYAFFTDYRMTIDVLNTSLDTSTPITLPVRYHEIICWRAIMYWAINRDKGEKYQAAKTEFDRVMNKMYSEQLPTIQPYLMEMYG